MTAKYYLGRKHGHAGRVVFKATETPTQQTHGELYVSVIGPFKTQRAAAFTAMFGQNNPHLQCVADAERIAKAAI